jgi:hypothetical protein
MPRADRGLRRLEARCCADGHVVLAATFAAHEDGARVQDEDVGISLTRMLALRPPPALATC